MISRQYRPLMFTQSVQLKSGRTDTASIIPTRNARAFPKEAFPKDRIARTLQGM